MISPSTINVSNVVNAMEGDGVYAEEGWACTEELMATTKDGKALYMHCLPADITGVSCEEGEVDATVFDRYRDPLYKEASFKPYIIAAMIFLAKFADPADVLKKLEEKSTARVFE